jgi:hypothetical protein
MDKAPRAPCLYLIRTRVVLASKWPYFRPEVRYRERLCGCPAVAGHTLCAKHKKVAGR